jgi:hypothetical protein
MASVPISSAHCPLCGVNIEAEREKLTHRVDLLHGEVNSMRAILIVLVIATLSMVIGGFVLGGTTALGGILIAIPFYGLYRWLNRQRHEKVAELETARNALEVSKVA